MNIAICDDEIVLISKRKYGEFWQRFLAFFKKGGGVMSSMFGASSQMQLARFPTAIYTREAAKLEPDQEILERSSWYANKTMATTMEQTEKTDARLKRLKRGMQHRKNPRKILPFHSCFDDTLRYSFQVY